MKLPIDVVPNTDPPVFRWTQAVSTIGPAAVQECEGMLPPSCERAVASLIEVAKGALRDNAMLRGQIDGLQRRADQLDREAQQRVAAAAPLKQPAQPSVSTSNKK